MGNPYQLSEVHQVDNEELDIVNEILWKVHEKGQNGRSIDDCSSVDEISVDQVDNDVGTGGNTSAQRETTEAPGESISDTEDPFEELIIPPPVTKRGPKTLRNRSAHQFSGELRPMVEAAANHIESITLFEDPLPDPKDSQVTLIRYGEAPNSVMEQISREM